MLTNSLSRVRMALNNYRPLVLKGMKVIDRKINAVLLAVFLGPPLLAEKAAKGAGSLAKKAFTKKTPAKPQEFEMVDLAANSNEIEVKEKKRVKDSLSEMLFVFKTAMAILTSR